MGEGSVEGEEVEQEDELCSQVLQLLLERRALLLDLADNVRTGLTPVALGKSTSIFMFVLVLALR